LCGLPGEQTGPPGGELTKFVHCGVLIVLGQLAPPGVVQRGPDELGDEDTVRGQMSLIHLARIE
jgi:hypothetical protein